MSTVSFRSVHAPLVVALLLACAHLKANPARGACLTLGLHASNGGPAEALALEPAIVIAPVGVSASSTRRLAELNGELAANVRLYVVATQGVSAQMIVVEVSADLTDC